MLQFLFRQSTTESHSKGARQPARRSNTRNEFFRHCLRVCRVCRIQCRQILLSACALCCSTTISSSTEFVSSVLCPDLVKDVSFTSRRREPSPKHVLGETKERDVCILGVSVVWMAYGYRYLEVQAPGEEQFDMDALRRKVKKR